MSSLKLFLIVLLALLVSCAKIPLKGESSESASSDPSPEDAQKSEPMTLHKNDLNWLIKNSPLIFVGSLKNKEAEKDERGLIITRNHFAIEKIIVGDLKEEVITLTTLGGTLGDQTMTVSIMPVFTEGQRYIIFTDRIRTTYNPITGNQEGVFLVGPDDSGVYNYNGTAIKGVENGILQFSDITLKVYPPKGTQTQEPTPEVRNPGTKGSIVSVEQTKKDTSKAISLDEFIKIIQELAYQK